MVKFTEIPDKLKYPPAVRAVLSTFHSSVVTYVSNHYEQTVRYRQLVVSVLNTLSYILISGDSIPNSWSESSPLELDTVDSDDCKSRIGDLYLEERKINWDVEPVEVESTHSETIQPVVSSNLSKPDSQTPQIVINPTPKSDLYLKPPTVPQFDVSKPWRSGMIGTDRYTIYRSLPEIPSKQNEISVTTDVSMLSSTDLQNLYPNQLIRTRPSCMYEPIPGMDYEEGVGVLLPIKGFTRDQLVDNIVKYPHLFKLSRMVDNNIVSFYTTIEIDGELHNTLDIWNTLPESDIIPRSSDFIKEYVARRYLLERDIKGIKHRYPMYGSLDPFLTLFTTIEDYIRMGYTDVLDIATQCVKARVAYKQTRNPILRRLDNV